MFIWKIKNLIYGSVYTCCDFSQSSMRAGAVSDFLHVNNVSCLSFHVITHGAAQPVTFKHKNRIPFYECTIINLDNSLMMYIRDLVDFLFYHYKLYCIDSVSCSYIFVCLWNVFQYFPFSLYFSLDIFCRPTFSIILSSAIKPIE